MRFTPQTSGVLDHGPDHYAGTTFTAAPGGRRVLLAWMSNWDYARAVPTSPFRGQLTIPRDLTLRTTDGAPHLVQSPAPELARFGTTLGAGSFEHQGVRVSTSGDELAVDRAAHPFHPAFERHVRVPVPDTSVRIFADTCSVEVFAGPVSVSMLALP